MSEDKSQFEEYDGIVEHDNPLPTWWLWTFFLTIVFSFLYFIHYELGGGGQTLNQELAVAMKEVETLRTQSASAAPQESEESLTEALNKPGVIELGAAQFSSKCASCHGTELQGVVGPNLVDKYWIHGKGSRMDMIKVVREGVLEKGMPPWGAVMKREEIYGVLAYVLSKKGTQPAGAKEPQGALVE